MNLYQKFKTLPFVFIADKLVSQKFKNNPLKKALVDILDGDMWSSKISFAGNSILVFLILLSSAEVVLSSDTSLDHFTTTFYYINIFTSIIFTFEIGSRILFAKYIDVKPNALVRYLFSFYGIVDILSILPFLLSLFGFNSLHFLVVFRIIRLWRITRYIKAFGSISKAFNNKKDEILVSLLGIILLSLTLSAFTFYAESKGGSTDFKNIMDVFIWSIGKYTGDYGAIASAAPITFIGKILATINGLLGIALFAIPAGLLGSAFIDELGEAKRKREVHNRIKEINNYFNKLATTTKAFDNKKVETRFITFIGLQSRVLYSDSELLECIRESNNLRFRTLKSNENIKYQDTKLVERFINNTSYGCKINNEKSNIYIVNPTGAGERCISHFTYTLAKSIGCNYISREKRIENSDGATISANSSTYYSAFNKSLNPLISFPKELSDFMNDLCEIKKSDIVLIINSGASGRADFIVEFGNKKGEITFIKDVSTIDKGEIAENFINLLQHNSSVISTLGASATQKEFSFTVDTQSIGDYENEKLGKNIRRLTNANVLTVYININVLTAENDHYFSALKTINKTIEQSFVEVIN